MTAIGVLLFALGFLLVRMFGNPWSTISVDFANKYDYIGGVLALLGGTLTLAGVCVWLWRALP